MAHYAGNYGEGYIPFSFTQPVVSDGGTGPLPEPESSGNSTPPENDALSQLWNLAQTNPEYMETYLQLLAERENTTAVQAWYEKMSGSQYQRAVEDLRKAGLNPALALTALSGAGSGSVNPAGTWNTSPYANKVNNKSSDAKIIQSIAAFGTALLGMLAILA